LVSNRITACDYFTTSDTTYSSKYWVVAIMIIVILKRYDYGSKDCAH